MRVSQTDYWGATTASDWSAAYEFVLVATPIVGNLAHDDSGTPEKITGTITSDTPVSQLLIEYQLFGNGANQTDPPPEPSGTITYTPSEPLRPFTPTGSSFTINFATGDEDASSVIVRAVDNSDTNNPIYGPWEFLSFVSTPAATVDVTNFQLADATNPGTGWQTSNPTVTGKLTGGSLAAFGVVQLTVEKLVAGNWEFVSQHRVTAGADGDFVFTAPELSAGPEYRITAQSVVYDPTTQTEGLGIAVTSNSFDLLPHEGGAITDFHRKVGAAVDDPTVTGTVKDSSNNGMAGVRVEFDTNDDDKADGFAFTDGNGHFEFTPLGAMANPNYKVEAQVVTWDPIAGEYAESGYIFHTTFDLQTNGPEEAELAEQLADEQDVAELAFAAFKDTVDSLLDYYSFDNNTTGMIDIGFGSFESLARSTAEGTDGIDQELLGTLVLGNPVDGVTFGGVNQNGTAFNSFATNLGGVATGTITIVAAANHAGGNHYTPSVDITITLTSYTLDIVDAADSLGSDSETTLHLDGTYTFAFDAEIDVNASNDWKGEYLLAEDAQFDHWTSTISRVAATSENPWEHTGFGDYEYHKTEGDDLANDTYEFDGADRNRGFTFTDTTRIETWRVESEFTVVDTAFQQSTRQSNLREHSIYTETITHSGGLIEQNGGTEWVHGTVTVDASGWFEGDYSERFDYVNTYASGEYEEGRDTSSEHVHYNGRLHATSVLGATTITTTFDFHDDLLATFNQSGSGSAGTRGEQLVYEADEWVLKDGQGTTITATDAVSETWSYYGEGEIESRTDITDGLATHHKQTDVDTLDAAFSTYDHARIEGGGNATARYVEYESAGNSSNGRVSSAATFDSTATISEQGVVHVVGEQYRTAGKGEVDYSDTVTTRSSASGRTSTDGATESLKLHHASQSGARATNVGGASYDFVLTDQGEKVDAAFGNTVIVTVGEGGSVLGIGTIKADPSVPGDTDHTYPIRDNEATTYQLDVTHAGTRGYDNRQQAGQTLAAGTTSGGGHVTRTQAITHRSTSFAGMRRDEIDGLPQEEPIALGVGGASGFSLDKALATETTTEDYHYTDDNGLVTRDGTFDTLDTASSESLHQVDHTTPDGNTSFGYREDRGGRADSNVNGAFSETTGGATDSRTAEGQVESSQQTFGGEALKYATRSASGAGNRSADTSYYNAKGTAETKANGLVTLDGDEVDSRSGQDSSQQQGRVESGGTSFRETTTTDGDTKSYTVSHSSGKDRGNQRATGNARSTQSSGGKETSTGTASAEASGTSNGRGRATTTEVTLGANSTERIKTTGRENRKSEATSTSSGDVTLDSGGANARFDVTGNNKGDLTRETTRERRYSSSDGADNTSSSKSSVTLINTSDADTSSDGQVTVDGGTTTVEAGPTTGNTGGETTIDYAVSEHSQVSDTTAFARPRYAYSAATGKLGTDTDLTLSADEGSAASRHASLAREWKEDSQENSGWQAFDWVSKIFEGEKITRTVDGQRKSQADGNFDEAGNLTGAVDPTASGDHTDKITNTTWFYDVTDANNWTKNDRTEISTLTTGESEDQRKTSIVVDLDVDNRTRSKDTSDTVTITSLVIDGSDTQTQTTSQGAGDPEVKLETSRDRTTSDSTEVQNGSKNYVVGWTFTQSGEDISTTAGSLYALNWSGYSVTDYTESTVTTEQSNYESTHKVDESGRAHGGKFTADSNRTESKVFTGSRDDPELAPENETAEVLEHGISSVENHVDHEKSKGRKVKESGTYEDDASGKRTQRGTYTETLSDVSKVTDTWGKVHRYRHLVGTNPSNYQIEEAFKELQVDANIRNEEKYAGSYDLDGHKREKVGETISDRRHQLATQKVEFESAGSQGDYNNTADVTIEWHWEKSAPEEGDRQGMHTIHAACEATGTTDSLGTLATCSGTFITGPQSGANISGYTEKDEDLFAGVPNPTPAPTPAEEGEQTYGVLLVDIAATGVQAYINQNPIAQGLQALAGAAGAIALAGETSDGLVREIVGGQPIVPQQLGNLPVMLQQARANPARYVVDSHGGGRYYTITDLVGGGIEAIAVDERIMPLAARQSLALSGAQRAEARVRNATLAGEAILTLPLSSDYRDLYEALTGRDLNTGAKLSFEDRHGAFAMLFVPGGTGAHVRHADDAVNALRRVSPNSRLIRAAGDAQHHIFPQHRRQWFKDNYDINVDDFTVKVDNTLHEALHAGKGPLGNNAGWWDEVLMTEIGKAEARAGRKLTRDEVLEIGGDILEFFKLDHLPIQPYK